jgi:hypothetical protein
MPDLLRPRHIPTLPDYEAFIRGLALAPSRRSVTQRAALDGGVVHVADIAADPEYAIP